MKICAISLVAKMFVTADAALAAPAVADVRVCARPLPLYRDYYHLLSLLTLI